MRTRLAAAALTALAVTTTFPVSPVAAVPLEKSYACQKAKLKATARAFTCVAAQRLREVRGSVPDFAKCSTALASSFAAAESRAEGECVSNADAATALAQVEDAAGGLFDELASSLATDADTQRCLQKQVKAARRHAACMADALARRVGGAFNGNSGAYFAGCRSGLNAELTALYSVSTCAATPEDAAVAYWVGGGYAYLPSYEAIAPTNQDYFLMAVPKGNLTGSSFANTWLAATDVRDTNFAGADLTNTRWLEALVGAAFGDADLTGADVTRSDFTGARLADATLDDSCWREGYGCAATLPAEWICQDGWLLGPNIDCSAEIHGTTPFSDVNFAGANLTSASFRRRRFVRGTFEGANLTDADLTDVSVSDTSFAGCDFSGARLALARMGGVDLAGADMSSAIFDDPSSHFRIVDVAACPASLPAGMACIAGVIVGPSANVSFRNLSGLDLSGLALTHVDFDNTNVSGATFSSSTFDRAYMQWTTVTGADMGSADLAGLATRLLVGCPSSLPAGWICLNGALLGPQSHPYYVDLAFADLSGVNLSGATLEGVDLQSANLAGADLSGTTWWNATCPDGTLSQSNGDTCCGHHVGTAPAACN